MIDKTIGVIPPRNELSSFPDKKTENSKETKSEFESVLKQSSRQDKKPDKKEKSEQALGGTKKKVHEDGQKLADKSEKTKKDESETETKGVDKKRKQKLVNEEMVLSGMASIESANKTPESEENLDGLKKTDILQTPQVAPKNSEEKLVASAEQESVIDLAMAKSSEPVIEQQDVAVEMKTQSTTTPLVQTVPLDISTQISLMNSSTDESVEAMPAVDETVEAPPVAVSKELQPQPVQVKSDEQQLVTPEMMIQMKAAVDAQATTEAPVSDIVPDSKVLETLNREQMFQKLETMKKSEDHVTKTDNRNTMDGISANQVNAHKASDDASTSFQQSADQGQDDLHQQDQETTQTGAAPLHQSHIPKDFVAVTEAHMNHPTAAKDADAANLKEVLNQAQYLVTKGGGEVTVKMTPEGMGEVQLKVMMDNGKMSVEMNTHDKNVQKLIQDSLSDLKSSLAAHQISVEHVTLNNRISTVNDAQNTSSAQNFADAHAHHQPQQSHQQDQRQQARQVFDHESNLEAMKALPLAKNEINKASAHRVYQTNKANSLNAVA